jgi:tetratricopeptide (TPR) repeat protein
VSIQLTSKEMQPVAPQHSWVRRFVIAAFVLLLVLVASLVFASPDFVSKLDTPILAAALGAVFVYLTLDRLREMTDRIAHMEDRSAELWQRVAQEVQDVASRQVKETLTAMSETAEGLTSRVARLVEDNPWLGDQKDIDWILATKHLEPVHKAAADMIADGSRAQALRLIMAAVADPEMVGTPTDYHNLGVTADRDLDDGLLAVEIYRRYLEKDKAPDATPDPNLVADALDIYTRAENMEAAANLAQSLQSALDVNNPRYTRSWRPVVYLAAYYAAAARRSDSLHVLEQGLSDAVDPKDRGHIAVRLADAYADEGRYREAALLLDAQLKLFPGHAPVAMSRAKLYWIEGKMVDAETVLVRMLSASSLERTWDGVIGEAWAYVARLRLGRGKESEALEAARRAKAYGAAGSCAQVFLIADAPEQQLLARVLVVAQRVLGTDEAQRLADAFMGEDDSSDS